MSQISSFPYSLRCFWCNQTFDSDSNILTCSRCEGALEAVYDYEKLRSRFGRIPTDERMRGVWRFLPLLPATKSTRPVTLGEGNSPLTKVERTAEKLGMKEVYVKDESRNPTLSFKDRKSAVAVTKAVEFGAEAVASTTAGNAGSSVAAYASKAGIASYIFTLKGISDAKLAKLVSYGAHVFKTNASAPALINFVRKVCDKYNFTNLIAASRYNPYVKEGAKTAVFEIYEGLRGLPDWIILPIGGGGNLSSYFKGVKELKSLGLIEKYPKIVGVQGKYCAPVVEAFERRLDPKNVPTIKNARTIAHSILDEWAPDGDQALIAIRETGGTAIGVSDEEIMDSMKVLSSKEGIYVEPASATTLAALRRLRDEGKMDSNESAVIVATGFGSNQPEATLRAWGIPPTIGTDMRSFGRYLKGQSSQKNKTGNLTSAAKSAA